MTIKGWPDSRRPVEPIGGWGPGHPGVGNVSGLPNIARRLDLRHPLAQGLVGWWPVDEMQGTRIRDLSIYGNHAATANMANPPTSSSGWGDGVSQRELAFDAVNDTMTAPHSTSISNALLSSTFTVMGLVYFKTLANYGFLAFKGTAGGVPGPLQMYWEPSGGGYWVFLVGGGGSHGGPVSAAGVHVVNRWYHVAAVRNGSTGYIYIDGTISGTPAGGFATPSDAGGVYCMFARTPSFYSPTGRMRQNRLYNRALSATEIKQIYSDPWVGSIGGIT